MFQVLYGIEGGDPQKVVWQKLLEFVCKHHLVVTNWPLGVAPPSPGFDFKKLKAGTLHKLVMPYLHRKLGHMYDRQTDNEEAQDLLADIPIECLQSLLSHPLFAPHISFVPQKVWTSAVRIVRVYEEWLSGDHAWNLQVSG